MRKAPSMARKLASLRSFYRYLQREGMVGLNPAEAIRTPKQPKHLPRVLTKDDAAALMEFPADQAGGSLRDRALLETLYSTGARVSELVGINLDDLRVSEGLVHLRGKGRKERIVPIGAVALTGHSGISESAARDGFSRFDDEAEAGLVTGLSKQPRRTVHDSERRSHRGPLFEPACRWFRESPYVAPLLCHPSPR